MNFKNFFKFDFHFFEFVVTDEFIFFTIEGALIDFATEAPSIVNKMNSQKTTNSKK